AVELDDLRDREACLERLPDLWPEAVAGDRADRMIALVWTLWRIQKIAAELANILKEGRSVFVAVGPEFLDREFAPDDKGATGHERYAHRANAAGRVIERQRVVHAIPLARIQRAGEAIHHEQHAHMAEICSLGQARRAGGV